MTLANTMIYVKSNLLLIDIMSSLYIFLLFMCWFHLVAGAVDHISTTQWLKESETLVSKNAIFKAGFFSPANSTNRYVGVWFNFKADSNPGVVSEVVWIANRDNPLNSSSGVFKISKDGNLQVLDEQNNIYWSSNISIDQPNRTVVQLLDTGNLVLLSNATRETIWQSFDHPSHVLVPPVRLSIDVHRNGGSILRSWRSSSDPSSGHFTMAVLPRNLPEIFALDGDKPYWRSGPWNGYLFLGVPYIQSQLSTGLQINYRNQSRFEAIYSLANPSMLERYVLCHDGRMFEEEWDYKNSKWKVRWKSFESECEAYGKCGAFGSCDPKKSPICSCLKGFEPNNKDEWEKGNWTSGCFRKTPLQCNAAVGKSDKFLRLKHAKVPDYTHWVFSDDQDDCERKCLQNCSCLAYAHYPGIGCMVWNTSLIDIQQFSADGADLYVRLAHSELGEPSKRKVATIIVAILGSVVFAVLMYCRWKWMRQRHDVRSTNKKNPLHNSYIFDKKTFQDQFQDLPLFQFKKLEDATNSFSLDQKIGQGGFGSVYKGKLEDGKEIAVKRLSRESGQGLQEFMNEVVVISKLQHRNLVKLLGCCVEKEEKILVYEFMPNKSLDALLFDQNHEIQLEWERRFDIIKGICRGLLYLHRDSRLKIIHRDLKASNILLGEELNPKISDFGMARIFGTKQDQANTLRVVGTYGYMSPEYALEGRFSEKSDIFSLGVLLLEIVSGKKNNSFTDPESLMSLLPYAWKCWNENEFLLLVDPTLDAESCNQGQVLKCIQLGLLCVQDYPEDRPNISTLNSMLDVNEVTDLPHPKQPIFTLQKAQSSFDEEHGSVNQVSLTVFFGR